MEISRLPLLLTAFALAGACLLPVFAKPVPASEGTVLPAAKANAKRSASGSLTVESDWCNSREEAIRNALYKGLFEEIYTKAGNFNAEVVSVRKKGGQVSVKMQINWG